MEFLWVGIRRHRHFSRKDTDDFRHTQPGHFLRRWNDNAQNPLVRMMHRQMLLLDSAKGDTGRRIARQHDKVGAPMEKFNDAFHRISVDGLRG